MSTKVPVSGTEPLVAATSASNAPVATPVVATTVAIPATPVIPSPAPLVVMPYGLAGPDRLVQAIELNIEPGAATGQPGDVALRYELQVVGEADLEATVGRAIVPSLSDDGQLAFEADCPAGVDCLSIVASGQE